MKLLKPNVQIYHTAAINDLQEIIDYFTDRNVEAGDRLLTEFGKKYKYLTQFPLIGRSYSNIRPYLRGILMQNYIIFYRTI